MKMSQGGLQISYTEQALKGYSCRFMSDNLPVFIQALSGNTTEKMKSTSLNGYHLFSTEVEYSGENAGEEDKEGERTGGERGMASLQSGVLQRGRRTEGCTGVVTLDSKEPTLIFSFLIFI